MTRKKKRDKATREAGRLRWESSLVNKAIAHQANDFANNPIPETVTALRDEIEEGDHYSVNFLHYIDNECEIDLMTRNKDRSTGHALSILRKIGSYADNLKLMASKYGYTIKPISNAGEYQCLYTALKRSGIDIKETIIYEAYTRTKDDGRMFFWVYNLTRNIFVLTIRKAHYKL